MSYFKAEMHQILFRLGIPRPSWGTLQRFPNPPRAGFKDPTSKGNEGREGKEKAGRKMIK